MKKATNHLFAIGDIVIERQQSTSEITEYIVSALPGDVAYEAMHFVDPTNEGMTIVEKNNPSMYPKWAWQSKYMKTGFAVPQEPKVDLSHSFEYQEPDTPEFDENCTIDCKPGDHKCGK